MANINITIDGPAGTGKSSTGKLLAKKLNYNYIDTGLMYRGLTYYGIINNINFNDENEIIALLEKVNFEYEKNGNILINNKNVMEYLYSKEISKNINKVTIIPEVRQSLVQQQRDIVSNQGFVIVGRDIGTIVLPNAQLKIYLTASLNKRIQRRSEQLMIETTNKKALEKLKIEIQKRDESDIKRHTGPLKPAKDAVKIDNSNLSLEQTVDLIFDLCQTIIK